MPGGPDILPGGILGVDMFFVLSSFLITGIALNEIDGTGTIDLKAYAGRRIRRLFPALFTLIAFLAIYLALSDPELVPRWTGAMVSALAYVANWYEIGSGVDYFDQWQNPSPLKHVWSFSNRGAVLPLRPAVHHRVPQVVSEAGPRHAARRFGRRRVALGVVDEQGPRRGCRGPVPRLLRDRHESAGVLRRHLDGGARADVGAGPARPQQQARRCAGLSRDRLVRLGRDQRERARRLDVRGGAASCSPR